MEKLLGVRCLYNTDNISHIELTTNYRVFTIKIPFVKVQYDRGYTNEYGYKYSMGVKQYCKLHGIDTREYFNIIHSDCN